MAVIIFINSGEWAEEIYAQMHQSPVFNFPGNCQMFQDRPHPEIMVGAYKNLVRPDISPTVTITSNLAPDATMDVLKAAYNLPNWNLI